MKDTTKKILLALQPPDNEPFFKLSQEAIAVLVPELSSEGKRSLLYLLEKKELIQTLKIGKKTYFLSTSKARDLIKQAFPALNTDQDTTKQQWTVVAFSEAPKGDPQFRYLRSQVLKEGGIALSRGVYVFAIKLPIAMSHLLTTLYKNNVFVFSVDSWMFGTEKPIIMKYFHLSETLDAYSSISKELNSLLAIFNSKKRLDNSFKDNFCKIYVRWFDTISEDNGLATRYFSQEVSALTILKQLQQILLGW